MSYLQKYFRKPSLVSGTLNQEQPAFSLGNLGTLAGDSSEQVLLDYLDQANGKSGQGIALNKNLTDRTKYSDTATEDTNRREEKKSLAVPGYLSPGGARELSESIAAMREGSDAYNAAKQLLLGQAERVQNFENTETPINWKPLLGWLDMMSGGKSNSAAMYREPLSADQRKMAALQLNQELAKEAANLGTLDTRYGRLIVNPTGDVTGSNVITGKDIVTKQGEKTARETGTQETLPKAVRGAGAGTGGASEAQINAQMNKLLPVVNDASKMADLVRDINAIYPQVKNFKALSGMKQTKEVLLGWKNALTHGNESVLSKTDMSFKAKKAEIVNTVNRFMNSSRATESDRRNISQSLQAFENADKEDFVREGNRLINLTLDVYKRTLAGYPLAKQRLLEEDPESLLGTEKLDILNKGFTGATPLPGQAQPKSDALTQIEKRKQELQQALEKIQKSKGK